MEVYLIRHTTPKITKGICYGQSDVPLARSFFTEAKSLLKMLPDNFDSTYSSPLRRCYTLAKRIPSKKLAIDERLLEFNFGQWEMKKWDDIDQVSLNKWMKDFVEMRVPGGENFIDLYNRVSDFITELESLNYRRAAIVTHGGVIRCFLAYIRNSPLKDAFTMSVDYASVTKIFLRENTSKSKIEYL
jgi:alpha-ribazole phosphatase